MTVKAKQLIVLQCTLGAALSSILFNIRVNAMSTLHLRERMFQFAGDATLRVSHSTIDKPSRMLQNEIYKLVIWLEDNHVFLNIAKTRGRLLP